MKILLCILLFQYVYAQPGFGTSYLKQSRLCHKWNCINNKLGLQDFLPIKEHYAVVLKNLLPNGAWQNVVEKTLENCYGNRTRRYTNTCPGQALTHCVVDQLIENCPAEYLNAKDGCSPVSSLAGLNYMFSQSRYIDLEGNLSMDRRPEWFLKHYFSAKCCELPAIFDQSTLTQCRFTALLHTFTHAPQLDGKFIALQASNITATTLPMTPASGRDVLNIVDLNNLQTTTETVHEEELPDPLECCDMSEFIKPSYKEECNFEMSWMGQNRLVINNNTEQVTTETTTISRPASKSREVYIAPLTCEQESCIFKKLNITSDNGSVDQEAYLKFLDNFTSAYPLWNKAKARVITTCLTKPLTEYDAECEINKVLACTFDVMTENCPFRTKNGLCRHHKDQSTPDVCQISSSKYRPKHRRDPCPLPSFVDSEVLSSCGVNDISVTKNATEVHVAYKPKKSDLWMYKYMCKSLTPSTTCLLNKMGVLNKYGFMDYFKMKDTIRQFTIKQTEWNHLQEAYLSAFMNAPLYNEHCNSAKKFLNLMDSMFLTCPASKRKTTPQCKKLFEKISISVPDNIEKLNQIIQHFHHVFMPQEPSDAYKRPVIQRKHIRKILKNPTYDYGILNSQNAPPVTVINVKPKVKPLVLLPVYLRLPNEKLVRIKPLENSKIWRSQPFWLHNQISLAHGGSTIVPTFTTSPASTVSPTFATSPASTMSPTFTDK